MTFSVSAGSCSALESSIGQYRLQAVKGCSIKGCECAASWQSFKKDPTYDNYMRAHRVRVGKMEATSPPGFGGTVKHMKEDHKEISNPHALAWYMYEKGDKSNVKPPKGTGAKTVSRKVRKERDKALKKKALKALAYGNANLKSPQRNRTPRGVYSTDAKAIKAGPLTPTTTTKEENNVMEESGSSES